MFSYVGKITCASAVVAVVFAAIAAVPAHALDATMDVTFRPGWIWSDFVYEWTITAAPQEIPFNDFEVQLGSLASIKRYDGPGALVPPPPTNPNLLVVITAAPGGFDNPVKFKLTTVANPNFVEGLGQRVTLTLNRAPIHGAVTNTRLPRLRAGVVPRNIAPGAIALQFAPGTFQPNAAVDLFQSTGEFGQTAHIGWGTALDDGSADIALMRPLNTMPLAIGEDGFIINAIPVPEPASMTALALGVGLVFTLARRRRTT